MNDYCTAMIVSYKSNDCQQYGLLIDDVIILSISADGMVYIPKNQVTYTVQSDILSEYGENKNNIYGRYINYSVYGSSGVFHGVVINTTNDSVTCVEYIDSDTGRLVINTISYSNIIFD